MSTILSRNQIHKLRESLHNSGKNEVRMLHQLAEPQNRNSFAEAVNPSEFMDLGRRLIKLKDHELIASYLDVFRSSNFLRKVYDDPQWPELILKLLHTANYTISTLLHDRARKYPEKTLFTLLHGSKTIDVTWSEVAGKVTAYTKNLLALLPQEQAKGRIAFFCKNSLDMALLDLACLTGGIVNIMIPANSVAAQVEYILNVTKPSVMILDNQQEADMLFSQIRKPEFIQYILLIHESGPQPEPYISMQTFTKRKSSVTNQMLNRRVSEVGIRDLASIMFTSGTTGNPKGIMFSHENIIFKRFARAMALPEIGEDDVFLCYLPLYHTFGRWLEMTGCLFWNARYVFMENPSTEAMLAGMRRIQPTVFISIPKKWAQLYDEMTGHIDMMKASDKEIDKVVKKISGARLRWGLSAAGHLDAEIFEFFTRYGIELMSGFGMTEATGGITMTPPGRYRPNSLGKALPGISLKLAEDGELLIKGPYVMMGYVNPEESGAVLTDGWLATGDIMKLSDDGFMEIVDRKKEIYKNNRGETIAPQKIENFFRDFEFIKHVFLVGDGRPYNTLLIYPDYNCTDVDFKNMNEEQIREYFSSVVVSVNRFLAPFERIVDFSIIDRDFSTDFGELTPKSTFRRKIIGKNFQRFIEPMYSQEYLTFRNKSLEITIPHWFLRECGVTGDEIILSNEDLVLSGAEDKRTLKIRRLVSGIRVGQFVYKVKNFRLNFETLITVPELWLGNFDLVKFTGDGIFRWKRMNQTGDGIRFQTAFFHQERYRAEKNGGDIEDTPLMNMHYDSFMVFSGIPRERQAAALRLIGYKGPDAAIASNLLRRCAQIDDISLQRQVFEHLLKTTPDHEFGPVLYSFLSGKKTLINRDIIESAETLKLSETKLGHFFDIINKYYSAGDRRVLSLMNFIAAYGAYHPTSFQVIRQFLVNCQYGDYSNPDLNTDARKAQLALREGFRKWLGPNQRMAVDIESGEEYGWEDVLTFEQGIPEDDYQRLNGAIQDTSLIREAVFLFSGGILIRLNDIPPGGVWVSLLGKKHGKAVYRITVQTRFQGSFDLAVNLNQDLKLDDIIQETNWLIQAGTTARGQKLVEDFGGYWPEYDLWSEEFIPGETTGKFIRRMSRRKEPTDLDRLKLLWPFFIWGGAMAYISFWMRTGKRQQLKDPVPDNVILPLHDYQTGSRIVSISSRKKHRKLDDLLMGLFQNFVSKTEDEFPELRGLGKPKYIFSAFLEILGAQEGLQMLENCRKKLKKAGCEEIKEQLVIYMDAVNKSGYIPKQLYFAIKRYQRWIELNSDATIQARAATLSELYDTYELYRLETEYPETRTRFYTNTVFANAGQDLKDKLESIITAQRQRKLSLTDLAQQIASIQQDVQTGQEEIFFLTRLSYPHLKPTDSADLISTEAGGKTRSDLVVRTEDYDGDPFWVRTPVNPKEISRLHNLFVTNNLPVQFQPDHRYMIAVNERGHVIGGLFFKHQDEKTVHMEKIVVADFYRKKGVSDGILTEFFNRMHDEHIQFVTTGFFRPEYFYRFGFKTERKYAGLVKQI